LASSRGKSQLKKRAIARNKFSNLFSDCYESKRAINNPVKEKWCVVTHEWHPDSDVKAAHIVPMSMESHDLDYLFGMNGSWLSSPRNGLPLRSSVEEWLDDGWIVIVPDGDIRETPTKWKTLLVRKEMSDRTVTSSGAGILRGRASH
jgi:hypothetical protein